MAAADLNEAVDWSAVECLNQQPGHTIQNALKQVGGPAGGATAAVAPCVALHLSRQHPPPPFLFPWLQGYREDDGLYLESDTDEQLLIHIPFNTACKLSGLVIKSTKSADQVRGWEEHRALCCPAAVWWPVCGSSTAGGTPLQLPCAQPAGPHAHGPPGGPAR
jgi:hypothetical protein